ncbi:MAG: hypothetical protein WAM28_06305 [Chlamydiales bacterium]
MVANLINAVWEYTILDYEKCHKEGMSNCTGEGQGRSNYINRLKLECRFGRVIKSLEILSECASLLKNKEELERFWEQVDTIIVRSFKNSFGTQHQQEAIGLTKNELSDWQSKIKSGINFHKQIHLFRVQNQ